MQEKSIFSSVYSDEKLSNDLHKIEMSLLKSHLRSVGIERIDYNRLHTISES